MFPLVGYILLFVAIGAGFIIVNLLVGKLLRPVRPHSEKETIYECGEPTIGSAWVQFDLRFYVVALLFVIFDVEVAFFFPWAVVFGKANTVASSDAPEEQRLDAAYGFAPQKARQRAALKRQQERLAGSGEMEKTSPVQEATGKEKTKILRTEPEKEADIKAALARLDAEVLAAADPEAAKSLAWIALWDILAFFGVLLVGFAYLWKRGDLQWVRSVESESASPLRSVQKSPQPAATAS